MDEHPALQPAEMVIMLLHMISVAVTIKRVLKYRRQSRCIIWAQTISGSLAAFITAPGAVLEARYCRTWRHWMTVHWALNAFTAIFLIANYATVKAIGGADEGKDYHKTLGVAVFVIVLVQTALGIAAKVTKRPPAFNYVTLQRGRAIIRYIHIVLGIVTLALLYAQIYSGFDEWDTNSESGITVSSGIKIIFWVLFGVELFAYGLGWVFTESLGRQKRARICQWRSR